MFLAVYALAIASLLCLPWVSISCPRLTFELKSHCVLITWVCTLVQVERETMLEELNELQVSDCTPQKLGVCIVSCAPYFFKLFVCLFVFFFSLGKFVSTFIFSLQSSRLLISVSWVALS